MLKKIDILNFKCFKNITIDRIAPVTIIGGPNNAGKSALLEAVMLHYSAGQPGMFWSLGNMRNVMLPKPTPSQVWGPLFYQMQESVEFKIGINNDRNEDSLLTVSKLSNHEEGNQSKGQPYEALNNGRELSSVHIRFSHQNQELSGRYVIQQDALQNYTIRFLSDHQNQVSIDGFAKSFSKTILYRNLFDPGTAERLSQITLDGKKKNLMVKTLEIFDESIVDVTTVLNNGMPYIYAVMDNGQSMPINYMGDGIVKAVHILLYILDLKDGILLLDEMENGFYYELYGKLLKVFIETAQKMNCQLVMTTHNIDIIKAALENMKESNRLDDLCYQRLDISDAGERRAYPFSGQALISAFESNMEIR